MIVIGHVKAPALKAQRGVESNFPYAYNRIEHIGGVKIYHGSCWKYASLVTF
jgi:hypothetical protein